MEVPRMNTIDPTALRANLVAGAQRLALTGTAPAITALACSEIYVRFIDEQGPALNLGAYSDPALTQMMALAAEHCLLEAAMLSPNGTEDADEAGARRAVTAIADFARHARQVATKPPKVADQADRLTQAAALVLAAGKPAVQLGQNVPTSISTDMARYAIHHLPAAPSSGFCEALCDLLPYSQARLMAIASGQTPIGDCEGTEQPAWPTLDDLVASVHTMIAESRVQVS